jgi:MATE family multidrug resistance protein
MWMGLIAGLSVAAVLLFTRFWRSAWRHRWAAAPPPDDMTVRSQAVTLNDHL